MRAVLRNALLPPRVRARLSPRRAPRPPTRALAARAMNGDALTLNASLRAGRDALVGNGPLTLVLGNEAADLDSIACAAAYAALLRARGDAGAVAYVACTRDDLRLRPDAAWLLQREAVDTAALAFADDVDLRALASAGRLRSAVLVDHNRLASSVEEVLAPRVTQIVDHHVDEGGFQSAQRDIQLVGSCSTLVTEHIGAAVPALLEDAALRNLLLGAVLLDTANLTGTSGRVTAQDRAAVALLSRGMEEAARGALFDTLRERRFDQHGLATLDLLRRDYKEWVMNGWRVGVSSVGLSLSQLVRRGDDDPLAAALARWRTQRSLDFLVLMTSHGTGDAFRRELGVDAAPGDAVAMLPQLARALSTSQLALEVLQLPPPGWPQPGAAYAQRDTKASRKVVQPLLVSFFDAGHAKPNSA